MIWLIMFLEVVLNEGENNGMIKEKCLVCLNKYIIFSYIKIEMIYLYIIIVIY